MAKPTNSIKTITLPDGTTKEIVPHQLTDGTYSAAVPTMTKDETLATESHVDALIGDINAILATLVTLS